MKIESVDFLYLSMPEVLDIGDGSQDALLVRVRAGDFEGWGECEASPLTSISSAIAPMSHSACKPVLASVLGQSFDDPKDIGRIGDLVRANSFDLLQMDHTLSGIDIALWDLMGKKLGSPCWAMAGFDRAVPKRPYASVLFGNTPAETREKVEGVVRRGFTAVKLGWGPFGRGPAGADACHVEEARAVLGPDRLLFVDAGTVFGEDVEAAAARLSGLSSAQATWLEEPFHTFAYEAYAGLAARKPRVALAGGEGCHNADQALAMARHAGLRYIQIDTGRVGGITAALKVARASDSLGVQFVNHTFTSGLALAASLVPFAGMEGHDIAEYPAEPKALAREIAGDRFPLDSDGFICLNGKPGLGVEVNTAALTKYLVPVEIRVGDSVLFKSPSL